MVRKKGRVWGAQTEGEGGATHSAISSRSKPGGKEKA